MKEQEKKVIQSYLKRSGREESINPMGELLEDINLLDDLRGGGWGRTLIETLTAQLREHGVPGVHLPAKRPALRGSACTPIAITPGGLSWHEWRSSRVRWA